MFLTRRNKIAGRPLNHFPYEEDPDTGFGGYRWGYCGGCNNPIFLRRKEMEEVLNRFDHVLHPIITRKPIKKRVAVWVFQKWG